ncbi:MAG: hypothetical protein RBG13Loki_2795, partial [Promethearchaeota archaeon CR_4]
MPIKYENIVPWGRSFEEYVKMFALTTEDLERSILGCGDGPASFNTQMKKQGKIVTSIDPIYSFSVQQIQSRIEAESENVLQQTKQNQDKFIWTKIKSVEDLGRLRLTAMKEFLTDYEKGRSEGRYLSAELPNLPFKENRFELALCSHLLFLYTDNLSLDFHLSSVQELCRVSREVRIFPLADVNAVLSPYVVKVKELLTKQGNNVEEVQ